MNSITGNNQVAFVPDQVIHNHILLAYELIKGYNRKGGTPRCMMQRDIQKSYDTIDWKFMECMLNEVGFPSQFTKWIMIVITLVSYQWRLYFYYADQKRLAERKPHLLSFVCHHDGLLG